MDTNEQVHDAVAVWRGWNGQSPAKIDYNILDTIADKPRDESISYMREITQVMEYHERDGRQWLEWAENREPANGEMPTHYETHWATQEQLNHLNAMFNTHRNRVLAQRESKPDAANGTRVDEQPLHRMIFGSDDVTWGNQEVRIKYSDCKSRYTGRCTQQWTTDFNDDGKPYRVREYVVTQGNRRPVVFRENEIVEKKFNHDTGRWNVTLAHKDRS